MLTIRCACGRETPLLSAAFRGVQSFGICPVDVFVEPPLVLFDCACRSTRAVPIDRLMHDELAR